VESRVDMERELSDPLGYGEGRDSECDAWFGLLAEAASGDRVCVFRSRGFARKEAGRSTFVGV